MAAPTTAVPVLLAADEVAVRIVPPDGMRPTADGDATRLDGRERAGRTAVDVSPEDLSPLAMRSVSQSFTTDPVGANETGAATDVTISLNPGTSADLAGDPELTPAGEHDGHPLFEGAVVEPPMPDGTPAKVAWSNVGYEIEPGLVLWIIVRGDDIERAHSYLPLVTREA